MTARRESHEELVARLDAQAAAREAERANSMSVRLGLARAPDGPAEVTPPSGDGQDGPVVLTVDVPVIYHKSRSDQSPDPTPDEVRRDAERLAAPSSYGREHEEQVAAWRRRDDEPDGAFGEVRRLGVLEEKLAARGVPVQLRASTGPDGRRTFDLTLPDDLTEAERARALRRIREMIDNRGDRR